MPTPTSPFLVYEAPTMEELQICQLPLPWLLAGGLESPHISIDRHNMSQNEDNYSPTIVMEISFFT